MLDLIIEGALIPQGQGMMDIGVKDGVITYMAPSGQQSISAYHVEKVNGDMVLPGLVEPHIHLEKAHLLSRMAQEAASLQEAIQFTADMKSSFTKQDMFDRSLAVIQQAVAHGVTYMRCHAEVDPILGLSAIETALEIKQKVRDCIDLQIVVFPQEGIFQCPGTAELMEEALQMGGDVVGGITYQDHDMHEHLDYVFKLANKYGIPIDFHADFSDHPEDTAILHIAERTIANGMQGYVSAGHVTSLGSMPYKDAYRIAECIAEANVTIMSLPATDLYINGRGDREKKRRGLTPVQLLMERGVNVAVGVNNVRNPFTPFGKADPLEVAWLLAVTTYMGSSHDAKNLINMITHNAAKAIGLKQYGLHVGAQADMVRFSASSERNILLDRPECRTVWKRGIKVADTKVSSFAII